MLYHRTLAGLENLEEKIGHFHTILRVDSEHPIASLAAIAAGCPLVFSYDPLGGGFTILPQMKHGYCQHYRFRGCLTRKVCDDEKKY